MFKVNYRNHRDIFAVDPIKHRLTSTDAPHDFDVSHWINAIYNFAHSTTPTINNKILDSLLTNLLATLERYYVKSDDKTASSFAAYQEQLRKASMVFSGFLQQVIYYAYHNNTNQPFVKQLVTALLNHPYFHRRDFTNHLLSPVVVWLDAKRNYTNLMTLSRHGDLDNIHLHLKNLSHYLGGMQTVAMQKYLLLGNHENLNALHLACAEPHSANTVPFLLATAEEIFAGANTHGFRKLLLNKNDNRDHKGENCLNTLARLGHSETLPPLLAAAQAAFADSPEEHETFVNNPDSSGLSAAELIDHNQAKASTAYEVAFPMLPLPSTPKTLTSAWAKTPTSVLIPCSESNQSLSSLMTATKLQQSPTSVTAEFREVRPSHFVNAA